MLYHFQYGGNTYAVKLDGGVWKYRDAAHLGGPWSLADKTLENTSVQIGFRRKLKTTIVTAQQQQSWATN